jgi:hypothetical protein
MASQHPSGGRKCARCFQPLPANTSFCVACGCDNGQTDAYSRQISADNEVRFMKENRSPLMRWLYSLGFFR